MGNGSVNTRFVASLAFSVVFAAVLIGTPLKIPAQIGNEENAEIPEPPPDVPGTDSEAGNQSFEGSITGFNRIINPSGFLKGRQQQSFASGGTELVPIARGNGLRLQGSSAGDGFAYPWGLWASYQHTDFEDDFVSTAFDADTDLVVVGADVSIWENTVAGVALGYDATDFDLNNTVTRGELDTDSFLVVPYFGMLISDHVGVDFDLSFDLKVGFSWVEFDQFRFAADGTTRITSDTDADRVFFGANVNAAKNYGNWRLGGTAGWLVAREERDGFTEVNGITVRDITSEFGQLNIGGDVSYLWGSFEPFARGSYQYDYEREQTFVPGGNAVPANDDDDFLFGAGLRWYSTQGFTASFEWNTVLDREDFDSDTYMFMIRGDF